MDLPIYKKIVCFVHNVLSVDQGDVQMGLHGQFSTLYCDTTFRNYCVAIAVKNCNTAALCTGKNLS